VGVPFADPDAAVEGARVRGKALSVVEIAEKERRLPDRNRPGISRLPDLGRPVD